jgi:hypothetical protein
MIRASIVLTLLAMPSTAFATWSIVAADRATGRVVIASATCVDRDDDFLKGVQAVVVPGKGVAACQAAVDNTHAVVAAMAGHVRGKAVFVGLFHREP